MSTLSPGSFQKRESMFLVLHTNPPPLAFVSCSWFPPSFVSPSVIQRGNQRDHDTVPSPSPLPVERSLSSYWLQCLLSASASAFTALHVGPEVRASLVRNMAGGKAFCFGFHGMSVPLRQEHRPLRTLIAPSFRICHSTSISSCRSFTKWQLVVE